MVKADRARTTIDCESGVGRVEGRPAEGGVVLCKAANAAVHIAPDLREIAPEHIYGEREREQANARRAKRYLRSPMPRILCISGMAISRSITEASDRLMRRLPGS